MIRKFYDMIFNGGRKGGTRKIADFPSEKKCLDPEHNPANMIVRTPGIYEHECPLCGAKQTFIVPLEPTMSLNDAKEESDKFEDLGLVDWRETQT